MLCGAADFGGARTETSILHFGIPQNQSGILYIGDELLLCTRRNEYGRDNHAREEP